MRRRLVSLLTALFRSSPLRHRQFGLFYLGTVGTALGYTMQSTVAAWLMATLTPSALMVALVQTASTAPALLFGLVAGALADIVDRRRVVLFTHVLMLAATVVLGVATLTGIIGPLALLAITFVIGIGFTVYQPAQQASINDMVPRVELPQAVTLGAVAFNVARAVGPALAGMVAAWIGTGSALLASAVFFVVMIVALRGIKSVPPGLPGVPETVLSGVLSGLRYARYTAPMRALLIRNLSFSICASALWALMPVVARDQFSLGAGGFGLLLGSFGAGAVVGALSIPRHLKRVSLNTVVTSGALLWVVAVGLIAWTPWVALAVVGAGAAGAAWVSVLASLSAATQSSAPAWVRARAVAMNLMTVQVSLAAGGVIWGWVATMADTRAALGVSAAAMVVLLAMNRKVYVTLGSDADVTPGMQLPEMTITSEPMPDDGPVLIQLEYRIDPKDRGAFLKAVNALGPTRRRNGAASWRVFRDIGEDNLYVERFIITSWAEYVRLRARATVTDRQLQERVASFQRPDVPIRVSRLLGIGPQDVNAEGEAFPG